MSVCPFQYLFFRNRDPGTELRLQSPPISYTLQVWSPKTKDLFRIFTLRAQLLSGLQGDTIHHLEHHAH